MAFRLAGGQGGTSLVPNLASAMPEVSEGGRTLTFTIRRDIRFSTGQPLRPADIKRGIDRALALESDASQELLGTISGVEADDAAGTVTVRLRRPDAEILYRLALPFAYAVPADTPTESTKVPLPATGPYRIAHISPRRQVRLERNPYFKSWSAAARPDGYPDAIVLDVTKDDRVALDAVRQARADWTAAPAFAQGDGVAAELRRELRRGHARQLHTAVLTATSWVWMNTEVAPFDRLDVRRAVALAIDRREIVERHGGPTAARATCRILPASLPGYRDDCPYGRDPDLGRARELIRRSGTRGARVTVWNAKPWYTGSSRVLARSLRLLGYRVRIKSLPPDRYFPAIKDKKTRPQIGTTLWLADYPSPSTFLVGTFSCDKRRAPDNYGNFCDPVADGLMRRAARLQVTDPRAGNDLWAHADARIIDQAAAIPLYNPITTDFVSDRLGNYQYHPQWGMLFDQAWVR
jgi:peptide/nickel transport system substrate-binding protein